MEPQSIVEFRPRQEGNTLHAILAPKKSAAEREKENLLAALPEIDQIVGVFGREQVSKVADRLIGGLHEQRSVFQPAPSRPLDDRSRGLWELRPVTFRYKQDPSQRQYGLIAEEVAKVYPELVVHGDKGEIESVQYRELIPLMLNEMQQQRAAMQHQQAALTAIKAQNQSLRVALAQQNALFAARLERLERASHAKMLASR